ncbi:MAG: trans-aconitate 2-methyltransferase [Chloroflexota bacterium]
MDYFETTLSTLEPTYLAATDPRAQSGFRGDAARWERARRVIVSAMHRDGDFLDIGCANGLLMESVAAWAAQDGRAIEPYGLDLSARLTDLARQRCPQLRERIFVGNALTWVPPRQFDFVRTELVYVPPEDHVGFVNRLRTEWLLPGGRLIICAYGSSRDGRPRAERIGDHLRDAGFAVAGEAEARDLNGVVFTRIAWLEAART